MLDGFEQHRLNVAAAAIRGSELTFARIRGMRIAAECGHGPTQINLEQPFPYPGHRTQDVVLAQMTPGVRRKYMKHD